MLISNLQIEKKKEKYVEQMLKNSIIPTHSIVNNFLEEELKSLEIGSPLFTPFDFEFESKSNSKTWNDNFKNLDIDFNLLYDSYNKLNYDVINYEKLYLNEKDKLFDKLRIISLMIENIKENLKCSNNIYSYVQTFSDFYSSELEGDLKRNLPSSNCYIDLINKCVKNNKISSINSKINISNSNIEILSKSIEPVKRIGNIRSILTDEINEFCYLKYNTQTKDNVFSISIKITLPLAKDFSNILFECISPTNYKASLSISEDNINYNNIYSIVNNNNCEWIFKRQRVSSFIINLEKEQSDSAEKYGEVYYYIFKNISCIDEEYEISSVYVSNPIKLKSIVNDITLCANENIIPGTSIDYFIGIDNGKDYIEWKQFKNNTEDTFDIFIDKEKILNNSLTEYGESLGNDCYALYKLPKGWSLNDISLIYGYQMWKMETLNIPEIYDITDYNPDINDYTDYYIQRKSLVDTEEYEFDLRNGKLHILTQYVLCEKDYYIKNKKVTCKKLTGTKFNTNVYVNNTEINKINDNYSFTLKKGLNVIYMLVFINDNEAIQYSSISHNFNFKEYTFNVFAGKPMKYINPKQLKSNNLKKDNIYYSIDNEILFVKDDISLINEHIIFPNNRSDINFKNNSRFLLKFKILNPSKNKYVSTLTNSTTVRVMANLKSNDKSYSPQLNNFRILAR